MLSNIKFQLFRDSLKSFVFVKDLINFSTDNLATKQINLVEAEWAQETKKVLKRFHFLSNDTSQAVRSEMRM